MGWTILILGQSGHVGRARLTVRNSLENREEDRLRSSLATDSALPGDRAGDTAEVAQSLPAWAIGPFARPAGARPVIEPNPASRFYCPMRNTQVRWEALHTFNPAAVVKDGKVHLLYRAEDDWGDMRIGCHTSRLGLAISEDGQHFERFGEPVFYPADDAEKDAEWDGGCEDPRLVEAEDGTFVLTYTQWARRITRLAVATSRDLINWTKHGSAFTAVHGSKYDDLWVKAGSIVCALRDGRLKAVRINGRYWMYWGEYLVRLAWSTNLIDWHIVEDDAGEPLVVLGPRPGMFDAPLVEAGPPAVLTENGIVLLYNARNDGEHTVPDLDAGAYAGGQALFSTEDPTRLLERLDTPFIRPERPFERTGQYDAGTTFVEGLVYFQDRWFLYYGCADSKVAVAIADARR